MVDRQAVLGQRSADRLPHRAPPVFYSACAAMNFTSAGGPVEWDKLDISPGYATGITNLDCATRYHMASCRTTRPDGAPATWTAFDGDGPASGPVCRIHRSLRDHTSGASPRTGTSGTGSSGSRTRPPRGHADQPRRRMPTPARRGDEAVPTHSERPHRSRGRARGRQYPRTPRRTSPWDAPTAAIHFQRNLQPRPRPHPAPALPAPPPIPAPRPSLDGGRPGDREHHKGGWRDLYQWLEISGADEMSIRPSAAKIAPTATKTIGAVKSAPFEPC